MKPIKSIGYCHLILIQIILICMSSVSLSAQISAGGLPYSFGSNLIDPDLTNIRQMPSINLTNLRLEDELNRNNKEILPRFGYAHSVNINVLEAATREVLPDSSILWRLRIRSPGAFSINFVFDDFQLPDGAKFFLYNVSQSSILGAFTSANNKSHQKFSTGPIPGDEIILEYHQPQAVESVGRINLSKVVHAYRNFFGDSPLSDGFGDAGPCNINVNCPEGDPWKDQSRSVAMILTDDNTRICSGFLVNNAREDQTPYFLTAEHCLDPSYNTWIIMFNYQSPVCGNMNGPLDQTISGAQLKANHYTSDFALLELSTAPPVSYEVFYSGWSVENTIPSSSVTIHHPSGDIKKISFDNDPAAHSSWPGTPPSSHWKIFNWDAGTTEPGSSGSPLFDQNQRAIGLLHGGLAACGNEFFDAYGKLATAWNLGPGPTARLKEWLDPDNSGILTMDGLDPNLPFPKIIHSPLENTEDLSGPYQIEATVTTIYELAKVTLYFGNDGQISDSLEMQENGDEYSAEIPGTGQATNYVYYITARDTAKRVSTHPTNAPYNQHSFWAAADISPPAIEHAPMQLQPLSLWPPTLEAKITDNLGIASAWVEYHCGADSVTGNFPLVNNGNSFSGVFNIDSSDLTPGDTIFYRIIAEDVSMLQNRGTHPVSGDHLFQTIENLGKVLIINDDPVTSVIETETPKGTYRRESTINGFGAAAAAIAADLNTVGFETVVEDVAETDPQAWENYALLISSSGFNENPLQAGWYRDALKQWVSNPSHKLLVEGGEVGYAATTSPGYPDFANTVLHSNFWAADEAGWMTQMAGQETHPVLNKPHELPVIISVDYFDWSSQDAVNAIGGAYLLYDTQWEPGYAGVSVFDNDNDTTSAQIIYFPFNYPHVSDPLIARKLLENAAHYLAPVSPVTGISDFSEKLPGTFELHQNYPNPFNPGTTLSYELFQRGHITLTVYDILGRRVHTLVNQTQSPGVYNLYFDASGLASGVYFYQLSNDLQTLRKKMLLIR